eukprot:CAMPEP_0202691444 /NCGR_PEP_ID=MMETSP1385-20130828/6157_1 /ASSEMBLY_ACC=CAM_ASM_000861 /TAXON_ID=933848 /ORGANISM="Elphidium margaritaceum" /LENGTH=494 /DNA_ID=CAMNT_0049346851 /DNA_START=155 /DNA_END=1639 /DNA_ORIENTATION=+
MADSDYPGGPGQSAMASMSTESLHGNNSTEKSIKSCYAVVYELQNRKWVVSGEGGWSEVHLCEDVADDTHRILAWTVKSQQVLMNCNVTAECIYKEKSKNFHSFADELGNRYGLGFHKSESGLKQAAQFLSSVITVIERCKQDLNPSPPDNPAHSYHTHSQSKTVSYTPQHPLQSDVNPPHTAAYQPQPFHAPPQPSPSPGPTGSSSSRPNGVERTGTNAFQPTAHLTHELSKTLPTVPIGPLGNLKILPPKPQKHLSGDKRIKNPTAVEHKVRVMHDKETGQYMGLPAEWADELNKQFGVNPKQLPGVQVHGYGAKIPKVLEDLRKGLFGAQGYEQVGIFRLAPNASDNKAMKVRINKGDFESIEEKVDVNVYANLIKEWFRDLPDPLLNCINPDLIEHVQNATHAQNVVQQFPEPNQSIFLWLCDMCVDIARYEKTNKMSTQNMAIVVGPNLFNTEKFENPMKAMTYSGKVVEFVKYAIDWRVSQAQPPQHN